MTTQRTASPSEPLDFNARALLLLLGAHDRARALERDLRELTRALDEASELLYGNAIDWRDPHPTPTAEAKAA